jgi:hypothetical protein
MESNVHSITIAAQKIDIVQRNVGVMMQTFRERVVN